ncbi:hypothetical protein ACQ4WP_22575, partial [Janthinobacterium sp. GB4P2]|uniref:hypothetical protein n=1 Tax=Janthinobacterium sp. GB4P2 TaxID=3424189 RepID=UPI003F28AA62
RFRWRPKSVTIDRNGWSRWTEMTGHDRPESLVTIDRNTHVCACHPPKGTESERDGGSDKEKRHGQKKTSKEAIKNPYKIYLLKNHLRQAV